MKSDSVTRLRRFSRALTSELGVLDQSFLGRGRPLGAARVLNAIGAGYTDISALRHFLGIDSGLLSRLLRALEAEALIETHINANDGRRRSVCLTQAGRREYVAYEALSDARARELIARHSNAERLLEAMDIITATLGRDRVALEETDPRDARAAGAMQAYYDELSVRFETRFDPDISGDPEACDMMAPRGVFYLMTLDNQVLGCGGMKYLAPGLGEIKRVWIAPAARGLGLSHRLMNTLEKAARDLGVSRLRLDTNARLDAALALYRGAGWQPISRYNDNPYADFFFEKEL